MPQEKDWSEINPDINRIVLCWSCDVWQHTARYTSRTIRRSFDFYFILFPLFFLFHLRSGSLSIHSKAEKWKKIKLKVLLILKVFNIFLVKHVLSFKWGHSNAGGSQYGSTKTLLKICIPCLYALLMNLD